MCFQTNLEAAISKKLTLEQLHRRWLNNKLALVKAIDHSMYVSGFLGTDVSRCSYTTQWTTPLTSRFGIVPSVYILSHRKNSIKIDS